MLRCSDAIAAESSTGTWTTVWTDGLTSLDRYKGRCYDIELVSGEDNQYIAYVAYPLDLFEEGSVTNILTSIVGNVFGFKLAIFGAASWPCRLHGIMLRRSEGPLSQRHSWHLRRNAQASNCSERAGRAHHYA